MQHGRLWAELRESVALLRTETWLFIGVGLAWIAYGGWVLATGLLLERLAGLERTVFATSGGNVVSLRTVFTAATWLAVPSLTAVVLLNRRLRNSYANLVGAYRLDHPSLLLAVPGGVLLGCLLVSVMFGQWRPLTVVALLGTVHLVVRTVAYGHRVYTFSFPPLLSLFVFVSAVSLCAGWLVQAAAPLGVFAVLSPWLAQAGVGPVAEALLQPAGVQPSQATTVLVAVPGVLASVYLSLQLLAGTVVRGRAPLSNPQRRPDQRFPIMPPVGSPRDSGGTPVPDRNTNAEPESRAQTSGGTDTADDGSDAEPPGQTGTRVFSPGEVPHESAQNTTQPRNRGTGSGATATENDTEPGSETTGTDDTASTADEAWIDDTAVFTSGGHDAGRSYCSACGESLPPDAEACPACGDPADG